MAQEVAGTDNGIYRIQLAVLEFDDIPSDSGRNPSVTVGTTSSSGTPAATSTSSRKPPNDPVSSIFSIVEHGSASKTLGLGILKSCATYVLAPHVLLYTRMRGLVI